MTAGTRRTRAEIAEAKAKRLKAFFAAALRKYGPMATEKWYRRQYAAQGGRCAICRRASGKGRMLGIDHNHTTGEIRGLLCTGSLSANTCNRLIAIYSLEALERAVEYKRNPPARAVFAAMAEEDAREEAS